MECSRLLEGIGVMRNAREVLDGKYEGKITS
jgi:hypothetical protein